MIELELRPHVERDGCHVDRTDARFDGELIVTSRQPIYAGARVLIKRGIDPATPMCGRWAATGTATMFGTVGEHATWTIHESSKTGITRRPYVELDRAVFDERRG